MSSNTQPIPVPSNRPLKTAITDHPLEDLVRWHSEGERVALITLVGIEGTSPRPVGAQMVVSESGRAAGYLSGGCLEHALILEAKDCIASRQNSLLRFGKGSPFIDIKLPCESGLDIYIDQNLSNTVIKTIDDYTRIRQPFLLKTNLEGGNSSVIPALPTSARASSARQDNVFVNTCPPKTKILLFGAGPTAQCLANLTLQTGLALNYFSTESGEGELYEDYVNRLSTPDALPNFEADPWCAAVLAFHDHEWEIPILEKLLPADCFYFAAIGSKKVNDLRTAVLHRKGMNPEYILRLQKNAGLIRNAKRANELALGIITEILNSAP